MAKIVIAGSVLVDHLNGIDEYPREGTLAQIRTVARSPGGIVPNVGIDLRRFAPEIPVMAAGAVGDDADGAFVRAAMAREGIDVANIRSTPLPTSFTQVMSVAGGERTFFTCAGACAQWGYADFPFAAVDSGDLVLLGYFMLLERIDAGEGRRILAELQRRGVHTAIDLVTAPTRDHAAVRECLPFVDHLIVNEIEAALIAGWQGEGHDLEMLARALRAAGAKGNIIIHSPSRSVFLEARGTCFLRTSMALPPGFIRGKTGAGDAFCAGALSGIFRGVAPEEVLELGGLAAVGALSGEGATEGMKSEKEMRQLCSSLLTRC